MGLDPLNIAGSALTSERLRMDVISANIANMNTTRNAQGQIQPYQRKIAVFKTILNDAQTQIEGANSVEGVTVDHIMNDPSPMRYVYDPSHPDANGDGYVVFPNISVEREMVDMATSKAAYEANITAIKTYKTMFDSALDI